MPTNTSSRDQRPDNGREGNSRSREGQSSARKSVTAVSPEAILDLVQRIGVVDLVADKIRAKLEATDLDEMLDELGAYLRRNPELIVVGLGTITVMAGIAVFLDRRDDRDGADLGERDGRVRATRPRAASRPAQRRRAS